VHSAADWPAWLKVTAALLVVDFLNWFHHWLRHRVPLFWEFHAVHHSQRQLNMFTDLRVHFVEHFVTKLIVFLPLFLHDLDIESAFWIVLFRDWYSRIYHANLRTNFGLLRQTPATRGH